MSLVPCNQFSHQNKTMTPQHRKANPFLFGHILQIIIVNLFFCHDSHSLNISPGERWPNGVVKYKLHDSLTLKDMETIKSAFSDYHAKTCIRFLPWQEEDVDFISLEINLNISYYNGQTCKTGGYQYARIGEKNRELAYFIELLGLALCLDHEHKRIDRDEFLGLHENCETIPAKSALSIPKGIYDYRSQWHWTCSSCKSGQPKFSNVTICGQTVNSGLSVLDADGINDLYNCQGCHRHRWRPAESLTHADKANMHSFGIFANDGTPLYPCRAMVATGSVIAGRFIESTNSCRISEDLAQYEATKYAEVLTIPGGLVKDCSEYKLENKGDASLINAIQVSGWNSNYKWKSYIAYATVNMTDGGNDNSVGNVWKEDGENGFDRSAEMPVGSVGLRATEYKVLTCSRDTTCMLNELYDNRRKCN